MKNAVIFSTLVSAGILVGACGPKNEIRIEEEVSDERHPVERVEPAQADLLSGVTNLFKGDEATGTKLDLENLQPVELEPETEDSSFKPVKKVSKDSAPASKGLFMPPTPQADEVYTTYAARDGVFALSMSTPWLDDLEADMDLNGATKFLEGDIERMRILVLPRGKESVQWAREIDQLMGKKPFKRTQVDESSDDVEWIKIYRLNKGPVMPEVHILMMDDQNQAVFVSAFGNIKVQ